MPKRPRERVEVEAVMQRIYELSTREQYEVYAALRDYLASSPDRGDPVETAIDRRAAALAAMQRVVEHLGLPNGTAPTTTQFAAASKELGLGWGTTAVAEAWGRFRNAQRAIRGEPVPESPQQRATRRRRSGRRRNHEAYLAGVARWLRTEPASTTQRDYDTWARAFNRDHPDDLPLVRGGSIVSTLGLPWDTLKACAVGDVDYKEAARQHSHERISRDSGPLNVVSSGTTGLILGWGSQQVAKYARRDDFPTPVLAFTNGVIAFVRDDIEAYSRGEPSPSANEQR